MSHAAEPRPTKTRLNVGPAAGRPVPPAAARPWGLAVAAALALAFAAGLLWSTQGGAVFYELVTAGLSACF